MGDACGHLHGGTVPGVPGWICGQCWTVISDRPKRYAMQRVGTEGLAKGAQPAFRQVIVWQADERRTSDGMTLGAFVLALAQRFAIKGRMDRSGAMEMALSTLRSLREMDAIGEFADPESEWSRDAAKDIADEEMTYWDADEREANG